MPDFLGLMKQASELKSKMDAMQAELERLEVEGAAGGGLVAVRISGKGDLRGAAIDDSLLKPDQTLRRWNSRGWLDIHDNAADVFKPGDYILRISSMSCAEQAIIDIGFVMRDVSSAKRLRTAAIYGDERFARADGRDTESGSRRSELTSKCQGVAEGRFSRLLRDAV